MKAIILSAGYGTRLLPLTEKFPKPLFPILNRPLIDVIIENLKSAGVDNIGINLHHLPERIVNHLGGGGDFNISIHYSCEEEILDTGGGLASFRQFISEDEDFIVHNCDILSSIDLPDALRFHRKSGALATMVLVDDPRRNNVLFSSDNRVKDIGGKIGSPADNGDRRLCGAGIFIYKREIFNEFPDNINPFPLIPVFIKMLKKKPGSIAAYFQPSPHYWRDIGSVLSYFEVQRDILINKAFDSVCFPETNDGLCIDDNARIGKNVKIDGFVSIGEKAVVGPKSKIKNCIIWEKSVVPENSDLTNRIITPFHNIGL